MIKLLHFIPSNLEEALDSCQKCINLLKFSFSFSVTRGILNSRNSIISGNIISSLFLTLFLFVLVYLQCVFLSFKLFIHNATLENSGK